MRHPRAAPTGAASQEARRQGSGKKRKLANGKAVQTSKEKTLQLKERHRRQGKEVGPSHTFAELRFADSEELIRISQPYFVKTLRGARCR